MNESESVAGQMGGYVAEAFFTYEQMRDQRDQALGRAEVAEQELAAAEAAEKRLRAALTQVRRICAQYSPSVSAVLSVVNAALAES